MELTDYRGPLGCGSLLQADYRAPDGLTTLARLDVGGVQARIVEAEDGVVELLITGSNERSDWHKFNFRWWPLPTLSKGTTGRRWHRGFLRNAEMVYAFATGWLAKGGRIDLVSGHSLGAAAAQIVGVALGVPTHAFASPKPLWRLSGQPPGAELVTNWIRPDDRVCKVPPIGFTWVGSVVTLEPTKDSTPRDHSIEGYLALLRGLETVADVEVAREPGPQAATPSKGPG
jgi:hypothetical protein